MRFCSRQKVRLEQFFADFEKRQDLLRETIGNWVEHRTSLDVEVSEWVNPYDHIHAFTLCSGQSESPKLAISLVGSEKFVVLLDDLYLFHSERDYDEDLITQILDSVSSGHVRILQYSNCQILEVGCGEEQIRHTQPNPGFVGLLKFTFLMFSQPKGTPIRITQIRPWYR